MPIDLIQTFQNYLESPKYNQKPANQQTIDDKFDQFSLELKNGSKIKIVADIRTLKHIESYDQLLQLELSSEEQAKVEENRQILAQKPGFFDGDQMLITQAKFEASNNTIYLEAKQTKFTVLNTIAKGSIKANETYFKTGVLVPFITQDGYVTFFERKADKLFSVSGGFCEPIGTDKKLKGISDDSGIFELTAIIEAIEETLGSKAQAAEFKQFIEQNISQNNPNFLSELQNFSEVKFDKLPQITSVSMRKPTAGISTIEFIAPITLNCTKDEFEAFINRRTAKDVNEHTENYISVSLEKDASLNPENFYEQQHKPGWFLWAPILITTARLATNQEYTNIPGTRSASQDITQQQQQQSTFQQLIKTTDVSKVQGI